jgi:hypothetical protein
VRLDNFRSQRHFGQNSEPEIDAAVPAISRVPDTQLLCPGETTLNDAQVPDDWIPRLASAIAAALREFAPKLGAEPLAMLALDFHPWHGSIGLAALTATEVATDKSLADPAEMAAWRFFDFARDFESWQLTTPLAEQMRSAYYSGDRPAVVEAFFGACAAAISSEPVSAALGEFTRAIGFGISVAHPDNGREFVKSVGGRA